MNDSVADAPSNPVTVTVYVPGANPVIVAPDAPLLHEYVQGNKPAVSVEVMLPSLAPLHEIESTDDAETERLQRINPMSNGNIFHARSSEVDLWESIYYEGLVMSC